MNCLCKDDFMVLRIPLGERDFANTAAGGLILRLGQRAASQRFNDRCPGMTSGGEVDINVLIGSMRPVLHEKQFVFATVPVGFDSSDLNPMMVFQEQEGTTLIITEEVASSARLNAEFPCKMITLNIHSSLEAVGFLAKITGHLAALNMGVNPVSGFYHDHLFVPADRADDALVALKELSAAVLKEA